MHYIKKYINVEKFVTVLNMVRYYIVFKMGHLDIARKIEKIYENI